MPGSRSPPPRQTRPKPRSTCRRRTLDYTRRLAEKNGVSQNEVALATDQYAAVQSAAAAARAQVSVARAASRRRKARLQGTKSDIEDARSKLQIAEAARDSAAINVRYTRITSPYDGVVTRRNYHVGNFVRAAGVGDVQPIVTVVRMDLMRVVVGVPETDVPYLDPGDPATVRIDSLGAVGVYKGRVARTAYALDPAIGPSAPRSTSPMSRAASVPGSSAGSTSSWRAGTTS